MANRKNWKKCKEDNLTEPALKLLTASWYKNMNYWGVEIYEAWYKNNGENPEDWIVVTSGDYFKVEAYTMIWWYKKDDNPFDDGLNEKRKHPELAPHVRAKANWNERWFKKSLAAIKRGENPPSDPNYQT